MIAGRRFPMHAGLALPPAACGAASDRSLRSCPRRPFRKGAIGHAITSMLVLLLLAAPALAQTYPTKPIRMIVPYPAGGVADVSARIVAQKLGESLGQQVVIENRAGASGTLGANAVAKAAPDGYTLLLSPGDFVTMPTLLPPMTFDPDKDLVPITMVSRNPLLLVANTGAAFGNVKELLAAAKANPGHIAYSTPGNGTINHLAGEWFAIEGGVKFLHVPYRGGVASANGVAAGDVPVAWSRRPPGRRSSMPERSRSSRSRAPSGRRVSHQPIGRHSPKAGYRSMSCFGTGCLRLRARRLQSSTSWTTRSVASCATKVFASC